MRTTRRVYQLAIFVGILAVGSRVYCDTISNWNGGTGNWNAAGNWNPAAVPNNSGSKGYAVTIDSGGTDSVTLDISPKIDSLALGGTTGSSTLQGNSGIPTPTLTVLNGMTVNKTGSLDFGVPFSGISGSLNVGGTLTNSGSVSVWNGSVSAGNVSNSGFMGLFSFLGENTFAVPGTLTNQGQMILGGAFGPSGPGGPQTTIGTLVNGGSLFVGNAVVTLTNGITDETGYIDLQGILLAGKKDAFANLTTIHGSLLLEGFGNRTTTVTPLGPSATLLISNGGSLELFDGPTLNVLGNVTNSGSIMGGGDERSAPRNNVLNVAGKLTNEGLISLGGSIFNYRDQIKVPELVNYGGVHIASIGSAVKVFQNGGSMMIEPSPSLGGASLPGGFNVGTGAAGAGYNQFADGTLDEILGGTIEVSGPASLGGTLDIMLQNGFVPTVGESFTILTFTPGELSGAFDKILGDPYFDISYDNRDGRVSLTAEPTPEPATMLLTSLALLALAAYAMARKWRTGRLSDSRTYA